MLLFDDGKKLEKAVGEEAAKAIARHHQLFGHKGRIADAIVVIKREQ